MKISLVLLTMIGSVILANPVQVQKTHMLRNEKINFDRVYVIFHSLHRLL